ncbi:tripartite motif-containing protein 72-like [Oreochromis niloticus]|uniref:tripartite motif-containing protein 72-like n=1 Tax=Oreochromis niloticus TaxID=8128 RepID=UPI00090494F3|nr:tripartite motif-containing protein 72-like [Oreochromis niloticus]
MTLLRVTAQHSHHCSIIIHRNQTGPPPRRVSYKSKRVKDFFRNLGEGRSSERRERKSGVCKEEQLSCCALCQDVLKDPVSTLCGHWFCRQCISSYRDQSASSGNSSCPLCGERSRTRAGLQTASQSSCVQTNVGLQEVPGHL